MDTEEPSGSTMVAAGNSSSVPVTNGDNNGLHEAPTQVIFVEPKQAQNKAVSTELEIIKRRLLIDGDAGDDKKLTKLAENYLRFLAFIDEVGNDEELGERISNFAYYQSFKSLLAQSDGIRSNVAKTYHAITTNIKASMYWQVIDGDISKEMAEMKALVLGLRQQVDFIKRNRKECVEREAMVKLLEKTPEREESEKQLQKLQDEYNELQMRQSELDEQIKTKKVHLDYLCSIVKRLVDEEPEVIEHAVREAEDKVLSDISLELE